MEASGIKRINDIIKKTLDVIEQSKGAIYDIAESVRKEVEELKQELNQLKYQANLIMNECRELEIKLAAGRKRLAKINQEFDKYSEGEMKKAYQDTNDLIVSLAVARERERQILFRRNDVERRLKNSLATVEKAEKLMFQVSTVLDYLSGDLQRLDEHFEDCENKRMLAIRIIRAQEDERRRIAREIHDGPAQSMTNVVLKAELCEKLAGVNFEKAIDQLKSLKGIVRECLKEVRRIIYDLRPMSIDDLGLQPTLEKYIENFSREYCLKVDLIIRGNVNRIKDENIVLAIFRVIQESLNNIRKHSEATYAQVQIESNDNNVTLRIKDDGKGFDVSSLNQDNRNENSGFGLLGMKERVELLEGSFYIDSIIGSGTTIRIQLPCNLQGVN